MPPKLDNDLVAAALVGYEAKLNDIQARITALRGSLGAPRASAPTVAPKRVLSPEGRARIVAATRKRWAAVRKAKAVKAARAPATLVSKKRAAGKTKPAPAAKKPARPGPARKAALKRVAPKRATRKAAPGRKVTSARRPAPKKPQAARPTPVVTGTPTPATA